jgi:hypothetical protein
VKKLYARIPHLPGSRPGPNDRVHSLATADRFTVSAPPGAQVVVEEKLDGSCVAICRENGHIVARGRDGSEAAMSPNEGRRMFAAYVDRHRELFSELLLDGDVLVGEWLALAHGVRYRLRHEPFVVLDLFCASSGGAMPRAVVDSFASDAGLARPAILHIGSAIPVDAALAELGQFGKHGAVDAAEGVVYRLEAPGSPIQMAKGVRAEKIDGSLLPEATGKPAEWNWKLAAHRSDRHEIHLTLDATTDPVMLRAVCADLGVKCLVIANSSGSARIQPMTSSSLDGDRGDAVLAALRLKRNLERRDLRVVRTKIERDARIRTTYPGDSYFEFHTRIDTSKLNEHQLDTLRALLREVGGHLSLNSLSDRAHSRFVTSRFWVNAISDAEAHHAKVLDLLHRNNIPFGEIEAERTVLDSHLALDSGWAEAVSAHRP